MTTRTSLLLQWSPRVLGILVCLFLMLFSLDAFGEGRTLLQGLIGFLIHSVPVFILLGVVALSWRWEWVGGAVFTLLAVVYAWWAFFVRHHPGWIPPIAGPLLLVGVLFLWSWGRRFRDRHATPAPGAPRPAGPGWHERT